MWSDTGNEQYNSRGDIVRKKNLDAFNLQGPNMSQLKFIGKKGQQHQVHKEASAVSTAASSSVL